jgi:hypothetical protein
MNLQSHIRENQINETATTIRDSGDTVMINIYGVLNKKTGLIINYKNTSFYMTRKSARQARLKLLATAAYLPKDIKIVQTSFINVETWKTAK